MQLGDDDVAAYEHDGAFCVRGVFDEAWAARLRGAHDRALAKPGPQSRFVAAEGDRARLLIDMLLWTTEPDVKAFVFESRAADVAARMMRSPTVTFAGDQLFLREPGASIATPWHQDIDYWSAEGEHLVSVLVYVEPVPKEHNLVYVRGSHRWGRHFTEPGTDKPGERAPDFEALAADGKHELLAWDVEPGDVIVHHSRAVHSSRGNGGSTRRRAVHALRFMGEDARYVEKPEMWVASRGHTIGAPPSGPMFPRVR